jgi:hypothetical protein
VPIDDGYALGMANSRRRCGFHCPGLAD